MRRGGMLRSYGSHTDTPLINVKSFFWLKLAFVIPRILAPDSSDGVRCLFKFVVHWSSLDAPYKVLWSFWMFFNSFPWFEHLESFYFVWHPLLCCSVLPPYEDDVVIRLSRPHATPPHLIKITCSRENAMRAIGSCIAFLCIVQFKLYCIFSQNRLQYSFVNLTASFGKIISYSVSDRFRRFTGRFHNGVRAFFFHAKLWNTLHWYGTGEFLWCGFISSYVS